MEAMIPKHQQKFHPALEYLLRGRDVGYYHLIFEGKVRIVIGIHGSASGHPLHLLVVTTNQVSVYDFVLGFEIENKGEILTAMTVFWSRWLDEHFGWESDHHLVAYGRDIDRFLPPRLRNNKYLQSYAMVVRNCRMLPVECVVRGYLTGSGWVDYCRNGQVCGIELPKGLRNGDFLSRPIFTPTTKAKQGHDVPLNTEEVVGQYGEEIRDTSIAIFSAARDFSLKRDIVIADTKFEFGRALDGSGMPNGPLVLADEILTPDSSRFWPEAKWRKALEEGKVPPSMDKEILRLAAKEVVTPFFGACGERIIGINNLDPLDPEHRRFARSWRPSEDVIEQTQKAYQDIFAQLTGYGISVYKMQTMHIGV